MNLIMIMKILN